VPPGNLRGMARRLRQLLRDPEAAARLGQAGVEMARRHSLTRTLEQHEALYEGLIATGSG
jgi:glycosyltransferase involved in cell wall biosynthesis